MVDPVARTLEILKLQDTDWTLAAVHGGSAVVRAEPFEEIGIELALVWAED